MRRFLLNLIFYSALGFVLLDAGITIMDWHYYAVYVCAIAISLNLAS